MALKPPWQRKPRGRANPDHFLPSDDEINRLLGLDPNAVPDLDHPYVPAATPEDYRPTAAEQAEFRAILTELVSRQREALRLYRPMRWMDSRPSSVAE
jgi:hypothetical protein